jgi:hypothetical protein
MLSLIMPVIVMLAAPGKRRKNGHQSRSAAFCITRFKAILLSRPSGTILA